MATNSLSYITDTVPEINQKLLISTDITDIFGLLNRNDHFFVLFIVPTCFCLISDCNFSGTK
ncbi:hypothetical protein BpHYR1_009663 [Brachionus plicatilis]|uniref:Uncharacterized protein n=1 Tax=Brachionus plicatilis TaxID=10195 RepID=A0A3M7QVL0_BRAPC|nr:hypothetical protein BpHYR1_009663 [Brachionus plicatilis]